MRVIDVDWKKERVNKVLVKFTPGQVAENWQYLEPGIRTALPPFTYEDPERMNNIHQALLSGLIDCWVGNIQVNGSWKPYGFMLTTLSEDTISGVKNLLIYVVYSYSKIPLKEFEANIGTIVSHAKNLGCHRIVAYTSVPKLLAIAKELGGDTDYRFVTFDIAE